MGGDAPRCSKWNKRDPTLRIYLSFNDLWLLGRLAKCELLAILTRAPREHYLAKIKVAATTGKACIRDKPPSTQVRWD
jgi:hypothetical protein